MSIGVSGDGVDSGPPPPLACPGMASTGTPASLGVSGNGVDSGAPRPLARLRMASTRVRRSPWRVSGQRRLGCAASLGVSRDGVDSHTRTERRFGITASTRVISAANLRVEGARPAAC